MTQTNISHKSLFYRDKSKDTPLHSAVRNGKITVARLLLEKGALIEARDKDNNTPLHLAALNNETSMVRLLLEKGASKYSSNIVWRQTLFLTPRLRSVYQQYI